MKYNMDLLSVRASTIQR